MKLRRYQSLVAAGVLLLSAGLFTVAASGQQVIQRGAFGKPAQVLDETEQWTTPLLVASDHDVDMYIPDVTSPDWLKRNYPDFRDKQQYELSIFTKYRTPTACRANQIGWGFSDAAHLDACIDIGYRVRQATIDTHLKTATLIMAAMVGQDGQIQSSSIQTQSITRNWVDLDANTQAALEKATAIITKQMKIYDARVHSVQ